MKIRETCFVYGFKIEVVHATFSGKFHTNKVCSLREAAKRVEFHFTTLEVVGAQ